MPATARRAADVGHRVMPHDKGQAETQIFTSCMTEENQMLIRKVLVVDDSATDLKKLEQIVAGAGYIVITATSGKEALERVRNDHPDAVLLDIIMNDMNGFQVCRAINADAATRNIPVVLVSSKKEKTDQVWGVEQGARAYVTKPFTSDQILDQLRAL